MGILKKIYYCCLVILIAANASAQNVEVSIQPEKKLPPTDSSAKLAVRNIILKGNKKTKDYLILREIQFKPGDTLLIGNLNEAFQLARQQVYNTSLFHEVNVELVMISAYDIDVVVTLKERWYFFPIPVFQVVERSFSEWLIKYKGDLSRVNYGLRLTHNNFSGRRDPFKLFLINGYTQNIAFSYGQPYSNKALTQGFGVGGGFSRNREMAYKTSEDNKMLFYKSNEFVRKEMYVSLSLRLQKGILSRHQFNVGYSMLTVSDTILTAAYNPNFFNSTDNSQGILDLSYIFQYNNVNNIAYPLKGKTTSLTLLKRGLGFSGGTNLFLVQAAYNKYWAHAHNWYSSIRLIGNTRVPFNQPYINQRGIGYGDANLRGLEYYIVDGVAFGVVKSTLKKKLISFTIPMPFSSRLIPNIPITVFAKTYADFGYSYNKKEFYTYLNNRFLYTGGFGIDILTLYDINLKLEYSFNQLGNNSFFFTTR